MELCTCARSQRPEEHVGCPLSLYHSLLCSFKAWSLEKSHSLSFFLSLSWLDQQLESPSSYPVFNALSSGITDVCRTVSNFCLGTGIQMAVFMLAQQAFLITKPSLSTLVPAIEPRTL